MVHLEMKVLGSIHMVVCKLMIVGTFDMMESLVMMPSSLDDGVQCDVLKSMENILFKYYMTSLKLSLKPLHVVPWVLNPNTWCLVDGDVWSYFWLYGYSNVDGGRTHGTSLIC